MAITPIIKADYLIFTFLGNLSELLTGKQLRARM